MDYKKHLTKGKWEYAGSDNGSCEVNIGKITCNVPRHDKNTGKYVIERIEMEANAQLIAEAGTVCNECGKTPRELLEERNSLIGQLNGAIFDIKMMIEYCSNTNAIEAGNKAVKYYEETLKKISG